MGMLNPWLLFCAILLLGLRAYYIPKRIPGIPYSRLSYICPWGDLASLGISYFLKGEVFRWFSSQGHSHCSGIFQTFLPSFSTTSPVVVVTDQREVRDIVTRRVGLIDRSGLMHLWFGLLCPRASIGMHTDQEFKTIRWVWNSVLNPVFLRTVAAPRARDSAMALVELWSLKADKDRGTAFEAGEDLRRTTLEAMLDTLLGRQLGVVEIDIAFHKSLPDEDNQGKTWRWTRAQRSTAACYPQFYRDFRLCMVCMDWVTTGVSAPKYQYFFRRIFWPFQKAQAYVESCLRRVIEETRQKVCINKKTGQSPASALEFVLAKEDARRPLAESAVSDAGLMSELMELLVAGHESTASALGWALKHFADYQIAQETLYQHLVTAFPNSEPGSAPTSEKIMTKSIPFLDAVISETLRLSCTGPVSFREAMQDCTILGHQVAAGTPIILMTQDVTHQVPFSERKSLAVKTILGEVAPLDGFHPERWLTKNGQYDPQAVLSMPFSAGARGCYGQKLAVMEMRVVLVILLWNFRFEKLEAGLSRYTSVDGLTRLPSCCNVLPVLREGRRVGQQDERNSSHFPTLG